MPNPDLINSKNQNWNTEGELFNSDAPGPKVYRFLQPLSDDLGDGQLPPTELRPTKSTFVNPDVQERINANDEAPILRTVLVGSYSAVRAAQVSHQYRVGFWDSEGVVGFIGRATAPNPSDDTLDQMWEDFELFSYLPASLRPSEAEFKQRSLPQNRVALLRNNLNNCGLRTGANNTSDSDSRSSALEAQPLIPPPAAFSAIGLGFCQRELDRVLGGG